MTKEEIRNTVIGVLGDIAPEADLQAIDSDASLRDQLDLDSIDLLNFTIGLHKRLGVEIPEVDLPKLTTLDSCISYLMSRTRKDFG